jgi:hypothetical protein
LPPEGLALYDSTIRFTVVGLGLQTMTPAGYDSVIDKIVPAAVELKKRGATAIDLLAPRSRSIAAPPSTKSCSATSAKPPV